MLLVFSQKAGAGLFLHNLLHTTERSANMPLGHAEFPGVSFTCNCADDFLVPFTAGEEIIYDAPIFIASKPMLVDKETESVLPSLLSKLRGPPVFIK
jgi:hypothetical protein